MRDVEQGYPIVLTHVSDLACVVVGGGRVGERKVDGLLAAGAHRVRVISPQVTAALQAWATMGRIEWVARPYQPGDLAGAALAFAATGQRTVNAAVAQEAHAQGALCNVADCPAEGSFHVPAVYRGENELVAVSTYGRDPGRARRLRDRIAAALTLHDGSE